MAGENVYPYLLPGPADPAWAELAVPVGHDLFAVLFADDDAAGVFGQRVVTADALRAAGLTPADAHRIALDNLGRFADTGEGLSIDILGGPGEAVHLLLYSDHPRAAGCLRLPDLYDHSRDLLGEGELVALVPQWESLVILPKRDLRYRSAVVEKLRAAETDAPRPLGFGLFDLGPDGVTAWAENSSGDYRKA